MAQLAYNALSIGLSLLLLVAIFRPLELVFPAKLGQPFFRRHFVLDLSFLLGQYLIWNSLVFLGLDLLSYQMNGWLPSGFRRAVAAQPWGLQLVEVIALSDLLIYWGHRLQHKVGFLWRFHATHHSSEHLDWLAAHREHPLDTVYTVGLINLPAVVMGFEMESIMGLVAFRGIWAIYIHSNVRLNIGPLKYLIGSPELHHWHHDKDRDAGNYANISPLMDLIFGTHHNPGHEPESFGLHEPSPRTYLGHLIKPLLPFKTWLAWKDKTKMPWHKEAVAAEEQNLEDHRQPLDA
jgi:sterol desaturase/sphingolipid hydroxylase (fatty acid hydroxylase superfamily)